MRKFKKSGFCHPQQEITRGPMSAAKNLWANLALQEVRCKGYNKIHCDKIKKLIFQVFSTEKSPIWFPIRCLPVTRWPVKNSLFLLALGDKFWKIFFFRFLLRKMCGCQLIGRQPFHWFLEFSIRNPRRGLTKILLSVFLPNFFEKKFGAPRPSKISLVVAGLWIKIN